MDRSRILEVAHEYYVVGIAVHMLNTEQELFKGKDFKDYYSQEYIGSYFHQEVLFKKAVVRLVELGLITTIEDDFAPTFLIPADDFEVKVETLGHSTGSVFHKCFSAKNSDVWIKEALKGLSTRIREFELRDADFLGPDRDWEPIAIDHQNPLIEKIKEEMDGAIQKIESNNGYAGSFAQEREYVIQSLKIFRDKFRSAEVISINYLKRFCIDPLNVVIRRFGASVVGFAASRTKEIITKWITEKGVHWISSLF